MSWKYMRNNSSTEELEELEEREGEVGDGRCEMRGEASHEKKTSNLYFKNPTFSFFDDFSIVSLRISRTNSRMFASCLKTRFSSCSIL
jgi:hypothetical protein